MTRRQFIQKGTTATVAAGVLGESACGASRVKEADVVDKYARLIPTDKGFDSAWSRALLTRGKPQVYTDAQALEHIGMPVGGLFAGTVYLGGDGRLWYWNIRNDDAEGIAPRRFPYKGVTLRERDGVNYVSPAARHYPFEQNFGLRINGSLRTLDAAGFERVSFKGQYPIGEVTYEDSACPVTVGLAAFSPFIPLNADDSSLPLTVMSYTVRNTSQQAVTCDLLGWLENAVCLHSIRPEQGVRKNGIVREAEYTTLSCFTELSAVLDEAVRSDVVFADFESSHYEGWKSSGTAFGTGPTPVANIPAYQGDVGAIGTHVVNSHAAAPGASAAEKDAHTGTLTSPAFTVTRRFVNILVGGGSHEGRTCVNLLVDGKVVGSVTGANSNRMQWKSLPTHSIEGQQATLEIVDNETGAWGNIGVGGISFSDRPADQDELTEQPDFGTMALTVLASDSVLAAADLEGAEGADIEKAHASGSLAGRLIGWLGKTVVLEPGAEQTVTFLLTWHFPNLTAGGMKNVGHEYAARFADAPEVARYAAKNFARLAGETKLWQDTWYDSTLPHWFLDRTMANTSILATTTAYRFRSGRFWAWEGVGCCPGTCTHVWHYAQAPGRLFPEVERRNREEVDFGIAQHEDGSIGMRAHLTGANHVADDGHCGRILGAYREHQMAKDSAFLQRIWPAIKKAIQFMIKRDANRDGILEGAQHNTLDAAWYGRISFLASLYLASLRAGEQMATEMGDSAFAEECKAIADKGATTILELYNGEYFFHELDPGHIDNVAVGTGCYVDQVFGQFWAHQLDLGHLFDPAKIRSALAALYSYNFVPHIGRFRDTFTRGRWYAMEDEQGLIMCSWPKGGLNETWHKAWQFGYFNECMTGFEWQAAAHMISEGLVAEGLTVARAIHDRYDGHRRNPYNEIECSDHYSRAMASYGAFLAASGYVSHGPRGHLGFSPKVREGQSFKCAFTAAGGWGSYEEQSEGERLTASVAVKWGTVKLKTLGLGLLQGATSVSVTLNGQPIVAGLETRDGKTAVVLATAVDLGPGEVLAVSG